MGSPPVPSIVGRCATVGCAVLGVIGCVVGLVIGLRTHAATAWFATFELGVPAAVSGAFLGLLVGLVVVAVRRVSRG